MERKFLPVLPIELVYTKNWRSSRRPAAALFLPAKAAFTDGSINTCKSLIETAIKNARSVLDSGTLLRNHVRFRVRFAT